jgi:hypothetical protein
VSELFVSRVTTVVLGIVALVLGIVFKRQNIAFMVSLAFAVVASANFPVLFVSVPWRGCTTRGATIGGFLGLISAVLPTVLSKAVWVDVFQFCERAFSLIPYASQHSFRWDGLRRHLVTRKRVFERPQLAARRETITNRTEDACLPDDDSRLFAALELVIVQMPVGVKLTLERSGYISAPVSF